MTSDPSYSYTWNAESELTSFGGSYDYTYDGDGKRVENSYNGYYYWYSPDGLPLAETNSSGTTQNEYIYFNGARVARRDSSGNVYYYFSNQIGSTNLMTNSSGTVCYDADRTPFGYEMAYTTTCSQDYNYAGMELDGGTGNYHTWFRNYEPNLGRWMSPDPLGLAVADPTNPQSFNLYAYVLNNPTSLSDPLGLCDCEGGGFGFLGAECGGVGGIGGIVGIGGISSGRRFPWGPIPPIDPPGGPQGVPGGGGGNADNPGWPNGSVVCSIVGGQITCTQNSTVQGTPIPGWSYVLPLLGIVFYAQGRANPPYAPIPNGPVVQTPNPTSQPDQTGKYSDYLVCAAGEFINQGFGDDDKAFATVGLNIAPFAFAELPPAAGLAAIIGGVYDLNLALRIRATCKQEVYGIP